MIGFSSKKLMVILDYDNDDEEKTVLFTKWRICKDIYVERKIFGKDALREFRRLKGDFFNGIGINKRNS